MRYENNGCDLIGYDKVYGLIGVIEFNSVVGSRRVVFDNDCIGFGSRNFTSLEAAKLYMQAFCLELQATGH